MEKDDRKRESNNNLEQILKEKEEKRLEQIENNKRDSKPVLDDLKELGYSLSWISDLYNNKYEYRKVIPVLIKWLPLVQNVDVKGAIVAALSNLSAKPSAATPLILEFRKLNKESDSGIRWEIGNALSIVADDSVFKEIVELIRDKNYGTSRQMLAFAIGKMKNPEAAKILIDLLDDETITGHAIIGLGKLRSKYARVYIEPFLVHPKAWIRKEAKIAIGRIDKGMNNR